MYDVKKNYTEYMIYVSEKFPKIKKPMEREDDSEMGVGGITIF